MNDALRLALLLLIAAVALTTAGALVGRALDMRRRLTRYLRQALGAEPQNLLMDRGGGRALGLNLQDGRIAVLWGRGKKGLVYRLDQLMGGEMMADNAVVMRALRDKPGVPLDAISDSAHRVVLRLVFDSPQEPEYELELWPALAGRGREYATLAEAVQAGRRWLTGLESILRRPAAPRTLTRPAPLAPILPDEDEPPPWDEDEEQEGG